MLLKNRPIRRHFDEAAETWYFSIVDVIAVLRESVNPRDYWFRIKVRVKAEDGLELSTIFRQLKLKSSDWKKYATDCANVDGLLRIIQSIPSPKAEPLRNPEAFSHFYLDSWPTLAWDCGFDVDPESLYFRATGKSLWDTKAS